MASSFAIQKKKSNSNLLKISTLKFNDKIISPHFSAKEISSSYSTNSIRSLAYETAYNTILYHIFLNSSNDGSLLVISDNILNTIRGDLISFAYIMAEKNVIDITNLYYYLIDSYKQKFHSDKLDKDKMIRELKYDEKYRKILLDKENLKKLIEANAHTLDLSQQRKIKYEDCLRQEQIRQEQLRQDQILQDQILRDQILQDQILYEEELHKIELIHIEDDKIRKSRLEKLSTDNIEKGSCTICLESYVIPSVIIKCGHIYCTKCIIDVCNTEINRCPLCKINITKSDLIKVFI